jgi:hypothetical protein
VVRQIGKKFCRQCCPAQVPFSTTLALFGAKLCLLLIVCVA